MHHKDMDVDFDKAQLFFYYILHAVQKTRQKEVNYSKLAYQLEKIRNMSVDKRLVNHVNQLEDEMRSLITRESTIIHTQEEEDLYNQALQAHLTELEDKLAKFQATHEKRELLLRQLERGYRTKIDRRQRLTRLHGHILQLHDLHKRLSKKKCRNPEKMKRVGIIINKLKRKIEHIKKHNV